MPRSFLIKPRRHRFLRDDRIPERTQEVTADVLPLNLHPSPGRISEDSGIEDCHEPFLSPCSSHSVEGHLIGASDEVLEGHVTRGHKDQPRLHDNGQLPYADAAAESKHKVQVLEAPSPPGRQVLEAASPPGKARASPPSTFHQRPIKHLPLIKRPIAYDDFENLTNATPVFRQLNTDDFETKELSVASSRSFFMELQSPVHDEPLRSDFHYYERHVDSFTATKSGPSNNLHSALKRSDNQLDPRKETRDSEPVVVIKPRAKTHGDMYPKSHSLVYQENQSPEPSPQDTPVNLKTSPLREHYMESAKSPHIPLSRDTVITRDISNQASLSRPWSTSENNTVHRRSVLAPKPFASRENISPHQENISPRQENISPHQENISPRQGNISPRVAPYHIPNRHLPDKRIITHNGYITSITPHQPEIIHMKHYDVLKPREISPNLMVDVNHRGTEKLYPVKSPAYAVSSPTYTMLTSRASVPHLLQERQEVITSTPLRRVSNESLPSPDWDDENQPHDLSYEGHESIHHNDTSRFRCENCDKTYATFSGLTKHKQFHCSALFKKEFSCKYCNKTYVSLGALKMHIRTHTLPCKCPLCGKCFSRPWLLQGHVRTHTGEKPFRCSHCSRSFADRSNLRAHLQTHTDIKKYSCKTCAKTFSRMSLLIKHEDGGCPGSNISF